MDYFWDTLNTSKANEVVQYFELMGYSRFIAALETTPQGRFIVEFIRGKTDIRLSFPRNRELQLPIADFVRSEISNFCGFDYTEPENIPEIRPLWVWNDEKAPSSWRNICSVFMIPVLPHRVDTAIHLYDELRDRRADKMGTHLQHHKVSRFEAFLQTGHEGHFPQGAYITHCVQSEHSVDHVLRKLASGSSPIAHYYGNYVQRISGMDWFDKEQLPRVNTLFDWSAKKGITTSAQRATTTLTV
jgi:hypothetical protein